MSFRVWLALVLQTIPAAHGLISASHRIYIFRQVAASPTKQAISMRRMPESFEGSSMTITEYPDPILRKRGADVVNFDENLRQTCKEMISIMYQAQGVGLAAPQVNLGLRLFVYNPSGDPKLKMMENIVCNPIVLEYSEEIDVEDEGCLSSRSECCDGAVCRAKTLWVEYQDERGRKVKRKLRGFEARVFQHEYDHIRGILHLDRFCEEDRRRIQPELDIMVAEYDRDDGILDITPEIKDTLKPPPLISGRMPPISEPDAASAVESKESKTSIKMGFGGGLSGSKKAAKSRAKKKKK